MSDSVLHDLQAALMQSPELAAVTIGELVSSLQEASNICAVSTTQMETPPAEPPQIVAVAPCFDEETERWIRYYESSPPASQRVLLRGLLAQVLQVCKAVTPPPPPATERLAESIRQQLEKNPIPSKVNITDNGDYTLTVRLPFLVTPETLREALFRMIDAFNVDEFGHIVWKTAAFDPSGADYVAQ